LNARALALAAILFAATAPPAAAGSLRLCDRGKALTAVQQDRLLRFAAVARQVLDASAAATVLVARSGLDLSRFGLRYSHAGVGLQDGANGTWSVRQLYYACDEGRPRLYDQGLGGFVSGTDDPSVGYLSILLLPPGEGRALAQAALDRQRVLHLLSPSYSANAYPWSRRHQNCNQWVVELLAVAWGAPSDAPDLRSQAQQWLAAQGYDPAPVPVGSHALMFAAHFVPWLRLDDHPADDRYALRFRTSVPASIEAFVRTRLPAARRIELCHDERQVVVRDDGPPIADGCQPGPGDRVIPFD
jgi:hypothetical protein